MHLFTRSLLYLSALWLAAVSAFAAEPISLSLDRTDGRYYSTDANAVIRVEFDPALLAEREWEKTISWQRNWAGEIEQQTLTSDEFSLPLLEEKPGQIVVTVALTAAGDSPVAHKSSIGLLYQPEAIALSTPEPEDFDAFWEEQTNRWRSLTQEISLTPVKSPQEGVSVWDLQIALEGETPVSGYLAIPENADPETLPAILYVHGAGVRSSILSTTVRAANTGFLALDINAHGLPNGQPAAFYQEKTSTDLHDYRQQGSQSRDDWYFRTMYLRVVIALDYLAERPEWNGKDLAIYGSSQGGGQALAGAGLDPRVTVVAASVPALCDLHGEVSARKPGWPQPGEIASLDEAARERVLETVGYFDGGIFARRIEAPVILSLGLTDAVCPAVGIQATLNNLAGPVEAIYRPAMGHAFAADLRREFDEFVREHVTLPAAAEVTEAAAR